MVTFKISFPTDEEIEQTNRFRAYYNYIYAISDYLGSSIDGVKPLLSDVVNSRSFKNIQGGKCSQFSKVEQLLRNAWFTEIQLNITREQKEFATYSNHWAPVQLYYGVYLTLRGLFISMGKNDMGGEHASNLSAIANEIKNRPSLFPNPWRVLCLGDPTSDSVNYLNLPKDYKVKQISALTSPSKVDFWDSFSMLLRTTRERQIKKYSAEWKNKQRKKRISPKAKREFIQNLGPTSLFNVLYRLRLRSNYEDADSFLLGMQNDDDAAAYNKALRKINWCTSLMLELLISRYISKKKYKKIVDKFIEKKNIADNLCKKRWELINEIFV